MLRVIPLGLALLYRYYPLTWRILWLMFYYCYCSYFFYFYMYIAMEKCNFLSIVISFVRNISLHTFLLYLLVPTGRVGIGWWTVLENKSMLVLFKKGFPLTSLGHPFERRGYYLLLCFESCQGIPYSHTGIVDRGWWTLC